MDTLTAFHEAGHATVSLLYGELPDRVTIRADGDSAGHTALLGVEARAILKAAVRGRTAADRGRVLSYLVGVAAGPVAQSLHMRRGVRRDFVDRTSWETFGGGQDYEQLQFFVAGRARGLEDVTGDAIASEAFDLLEQPEVWSSVEHLADDLLRFKELDYQGIYDAVMNHDLIGGRGQ
jgi:hypothetical protein